MKCSSQNHRENLVAELLAWWDNTQSRHKMSIIPANSILWCAAYLKNIQVTHFHADLV